MTSCARPAQTADAPKQIKRSEPSSEAEKKREREMERVREREGGQATYSQWAAYGFRFTISQTGPLCSDAACPLLRLFFGFENYFGSN